MLEDSGSPPPSDSPVLPNPLREGLAEERVPEPAVMVIFGASGDLAHRKLLPALYSLTRDRLLPARFAIVGFAAPRGSRRGVSRGDAAIAAAEHARRRPIDPELWSAFARNIFYHQASTTIPRRSCRSSSGSRRSNGRSACRGNRVFYLATPPSSFASVIRSLGEAQLAPQAAARRRAEADRPAAAVRTRHHREAVRRRPRRRRARSTATSTRRWTSARSTGSITTSAKRPSRTCSSSASPTASSSRSGTTASSTTCRSPAPRASASKGAAATSSRRAACATWCRTTCSRSLSLFAMEPPIAFDPDVGARRKAEGAQGVARHPCK